MFASEVSDAYIFRVRCKHLNVRMHVSEDSDTRIWQFRGMYLKRLDSRCMHLKGQMHVSVGSDDIIWKFIITKSLSEF